MRMWSLAGRPSPVAMSHAGKYVVRCAATSGGAVTNGANTMEEMFVSSNYEKGDLICRTVISEQVCARAYVCVSSSEGSLCPSAERDRDGDGDVAGMTCAHRRTPMPVSLRRCSSCCRPGLTPTVSSIWAPR